jgi:hypothetical protein
VNTYFRIEKIFPPYQNQKPPRGSPKMAKKKTNAEDEWFEDDFEEEPKPKKKKGRRKKKKTGKAVAWVIAFIVILAILLFIRFKYTTPSDTDTTDDEEAPEPEVIERVVPEPDDSDDDTGSTYEEPKYAGPDVVDKEDLPKVSEVIDTTAEPVLFSNIQCDYDYTDELLYISLRVYNTLNKDMLISPRGVMKGYNTYFKIRGIVDTDPGCDTERLKPGEYTECDKIGFDTARYGNVEGINRISVQVPGKTEALLVECPAKPASSSSEE